MIVFQYCNSYPVYNSTSFLHLTLGL